jgi:zinc protease
MKLSHLLVGALALAAAPPAHAELDLKRADVSHLANGLTVIVLEDHSFPVVSTQMLYKSGARDETAGKTGLAHFLEHLAFRGSGNFPNAAATEAIYDAGGEWHGYTWLDQTTYFATMPKDGLDLLLRIEADRMARVTIDPAAIAAEKGAVITEMHGYENDPASMLLDAVTATALQAHPYRNNTIGYESDVEALTADDARDFYRTHYAPANAVLAIVGDVTLDQAKALVRQHFAALPARQLATRPAAVEPPQLGERRTELVGPVARQQFVIAYPAPAASSADFPAFLVLQQLLSGGSGVNFRQNDWGTPSVAGAALHGLTGDLQTWLIATADRYLFTVQGSTAKGSERSALERGLERRLERMRSTDPTPQQLAAATSAVAAQLGEDIESTEDAAHQLAYFEGIGALDALLDLPNRVAAVTPGDVRRVAAAYLTPRQRTFGWYIPGPSDATANLGVGAPRAAASRPGARSPSSPAPPPSLIRLPGGLPAVVQQSPLSHTVTVELLLSAPVAGENAAADLPSLGTIVRSGRPEQLPKLLASARAALSRPAPPAAPPSDDPETRLNQMVAARMALPQRAAPQPLLAVISGDVTAQSATAALTRALGSVRPGSLAKPAAPRPPQSGLRTLTERIDLPLAQGALGYVVDAPPPGTREGLAWRLLLYILTHDYSGRLGRSAIGDKGLVYHIYSRYPTNGARSWVAISTGVDPDKSDAMEAELRLQLQRLATDPPTADEVQAARRHLLGRDLSAAQTNSELADRLIRQFLEIDGPRSHAALAAMLNGIAPAEVAAAAAPFARGTILRVDVGRAAPRP